MLYTMLLAYNDDADDNDYDLWSPLLLRAMIMLILMPMLMMMVVIKRLDLHLVYASLC